MATRARLEPDIFRNYITLDLVEGPLRFVRILHSRENEQVPICSFGFHTKLDLAFQPILLAPMFL